MKKPPLQSAFEKLDDDELAAIAKLVGDPAGAAAACWVLADQVARERKRRDGTATIRPATSEDDLKRQFFRLGTDGTLAEIRTVAGAMIDRKKVGMKSLDTPGFRSGLQAAHRVNLVFGDECQRAAQSGDVDFLRAAADGVEVAHSRRRTAAPDRQAAHVTAALLVLKDHAAKSNGLPRVTKKAAREAIEKRLHEIRVKPFEDAASWIALWKRPELAAYFVQAHDNGSGGKTSGHGRAVELHDLGDLAD